MDIKGNLLDNLGLAVPFSHFLIDTIDIIAARIPIRKEQGYFIMRFYRQIMKNHKNNSTILDSGKFRCLPVG